MDDILKDMMSQTPQAEPVEETIEEEKNRPHDQDDEAIKAMIMSPGSSTELNTNFEDEDEDADREPALMELKSEGAEFSEKYKKTLVKKAQENPKSVLIDTPEGKMTIEEALERGYNPETGQFDGEELHKPRPEEYFGDLSPEELAQMERMLDPRSEDIMPNEMERMGIGYDEYPDVDPGVHPPEEEMGGDPLANILRGGGM